MSFGSRERTGTSAQTYSETGELVLLRHTIDNVAAGGVEVIKVVPTVEMELGLLGRRHTVGDVVEDVVVALALGLAHDTRLFEQVRNDTSSVNVTILIELDLNELTL